MQTACRRPIMPFMIQPVAPRLLMTAVPYMTGFAPNLSGRNQPKTYFCNRNKGLGSNGTESRFRISCSARQSLACRHINGLAGQRGTRKCRISVTASRLIATRKLQQDQSFHGLNPTFCSPATQTPILPTQNSPEAYRGEFRVATTKPAVGFILWRFCLWLSDN